MNLGNLARGGANAISRFGQMINAPVLFDWNTKAAQDDVASGSDKRGMDSAAYKAYQSQNDPNAGIFGATSDLNRRTAEFANSIETPTPRTPGDFTGSGTQASTGPSGAVVNPLLTALESTGTIRQNALNEAQGLFDRNMAAYKTEDAQDLANYQKQVTQNESNLAGGRQAAQLQAAVGGKGLRGVLASLGALSGTGMQLADRAVSRAANKDIGEAQESFETNAEGLNTNWSNTERQQRQRRADAEAALTNDQRAAESNYATSRQGILTQLANLFGADSARGGQYASEAASLYPTIAQNSARAVGSYAAPSSLYSPQALDAYKGGVQDLTVDTSAGSGSGGQNPNALLAQDPLRRRREEELV